MCIHNNKKHLGCFPAEYLCSSHRDTAHILFSPLHVESGFLRVLYLDGVHDDSEAGHSELIGVPQVVVIQVAEGQKIIVDTTDIIQGCGRYRSTNITR